IYSDSEASDDSESELEGNDTEEELRDFREVTVANDSEYNPRPQFMEIAEPKHMPARNSMPRAYFDLFFTEEFLSLLRSETNRYARQFLNRINVPSGSRITEWKATTVSEIRAFIAVLLEMGITRRPTLFSYWSTNHRQIPWFGQMFSRNRFQLVCRFFHVVDNEKLPARDNPEYDPTAKFQSVVIHANNKFKFHYSPNQHLSIDESLVGTKCRTSLIQYLPNKKHHRWECTIEISEWEKFYKELHKESTDTKYCIIDVKHQYLDKDIEMTELNIVLKRLKVKKTPGPDGITNEFYKYLPENMKEVLLKIMNKAINTEEIPSSWETSNTIMLFKKGNKHDPNNYRGITLANSITKLFTAIIARRINIWTKSCDILPEGQPGFRTNRSCEDNVFVLGSKIAKALAKPKGKTYLLFVDFKKAFDSVWHSILWYKLHKAGISSQLLRTIRNLYKQANTQIKTDKNKKTGNIKINKGVLQGDSLSPTLFSLMIHDIDKYFEENGHNRIIKDMEILLFADDLVIIASNPID
ncbi:hypothetical protein KPH14_012258, partial [Odynerus spinipes]